MSMNTAGYRVARKYLDSLLDLEPNKFEGLLANNVVMYHTTNGKKSVVTERDKVVLEYAENFFSCTSDFDISRVEITANGLNPYMTCEVKETKMTLRGPQRVAIHDRTELRLTQQDGRWKILQIVSDVAMLKVENQPSETAKAV
jgi:hypothetical protein